jgi:hypothetical protein
MITGNDADTIVVRTYEEDNEVMDVINMFLADLLDE